MSRPRLIFSCVVAAFFAIPIVTLVSMTVVFPILFYGVLAAVANFGGPVLLAASGLQKLGFRFDLQKHLDGWSQCSIIWSGCALGISRWGDVGASLGAKNSPFFEILFAPYLLLMGYTVG